MHDFEILHQPSKRARARSTRRKKLLQCTSFCTTTPVRTNLGKYDCGRRPLQCWREGAGALRGEEKKNSVAGGHILAASALKGPKRTIAFSQVSSDGGCWGFLPDSLPKCPPPVVLQPTPQPSGDNAQITACDRAQAKRNGQVDLSQAVGQEGDTALPPF